uniref:Phage-related protein n=1 Tax=Candidatus Kentrum sp. TUN TaxID=2126343 RepID=A0A450ZTD6_9GAMM|nr:MAG: Phage-related protein [Candidatus Kentron sp. TUN]VFK53623.1 MAG: Phage-related protein [Candidatus Kentron sp. TUN]VFK57056.1 MAG: Phage-related protein [Candidatus Kentron sp. TUN]
MREIIFYRTAGGRSPVEEFLDSLSSKQARKVVWVIQLVEEVDLVPIRYFKKLAGTNEIWEVRVDAGSDTFRILGFPDGKRFVVLNHAFQKKARKTPEKEIRVAEKRKHDYLKRKKLS